MNINSNIVKDLEVLKYTESSQKKYMILTDLSVLAISFVNGYVNEIMYLKDAKNTSFSVRSLFDRVKEFYVNTDDPVSYLLSMLSFLLTMAIALAVIVAKGEKESMLSKLSYWLCVGSGSCLIVLTPSLFNVLGVVKAIFVFVVYNVIIYYLGRLSLIIGKDEFAQAQKMIDERALSVYFNLYKRYEVSGELGSKGVINLILFVSCVVILLGFALAVRVIYVSAGCLGVTSINLSIFMVTYIFGLFALIKNEERGLNRILLILSLSFPLIAMTVLLLFLLWHYKIIFILFSLSVIAYTWLWISSILSGLSLVQFNSFIDSHRVLSYIFTNPVVLIYRIKQKYYINKIKAIKRHLEQSAAFREERVQPSSLR